MDWAQDNARLSDMNLNSVFKFDPRQSTVVEMLNSNDHEAIISTLTSDQDWIDWLSKPQSSRDANHGLTLILARRTGESVTGEVKGVSIAECLRVLSMDSTFSGPTHSAAHCTSGSEKSPTGIASEGGQKQATYVSPRRGVRTLPFSEKTFKLITEHFHTHGSIAKAISRSDAPLCSCESVEMGESSYVYNCRTSNAWNLDLALSATYFPRTRRTYAILYGCTLSHERHILRRLQGARREVTYPLLIPGIFVELERSRHAELVEKMMMKLEQKIFDFSADGMKSSLGSEEKYKRNEAKRTDWLDAVYLKNSLTTWKMQLLKLSSHTNELEELASSEYTMAARARMDTDTTALGDANATVFVSDREYFSDTDYCESPILSPDEKGAPTKKAAMQRSSNVLGKKFRDRLSAIQDEYDDWIRDCSMRVEGMAMATQWASGETNVEIALSTRRDSKYMRSIAILTMIFLPGTWLAGVFSMSFFDWNTSGKSPYVSSYFWIYVVLTIGLTGLTVGCWYYLTVYRRKHLREKSEDGDDSDVELGLSFLPRH